MTRLNVYAGPAGDKAMPHSRTLCTLMLSLVLLLVGTGSVFALPLQDRPTRLGPAALQAEPGWEQVNSNGFGDLDAGEVTALAVFNNYLYAGTHNAADGALILRSPDGVSWTAVIEPGFGIPHDTAPPAILDLTVYGTYLYASTGRGQDPAKIWRTSNGLYWLPVVNSGFSGADTVDISALAGYGGMLYAGTSDRIGGAQIWRSYTGDSNSWTQDSPASLVGEPAGVTGFAVFGGALYATVESDGPAQIWRTYGGSSGWAPVMSDGFGSHLTTLTGGMAVFGDYLYAGAGNSAVGAQLWRSLDGESWVPAATPGAAGGNNEAVESLFVFGSQLYASLRNAATGIEVWHSADGATWEQSNLDGFGDSDNAGTNRGNATTAFLSRLFVGTANTLEGGELWRLTPAVSPAQKVYLPTVQRLP